MNATQILIDEIEAFCRGAGIQPSTVGRIARNDGKLYARLKAGGTVTLETAERVRGFMRAYKGEIKGRRPRIGCSGPTFGGAVSGPAPAH